MTEAVAIIERNGTLAQTALQPQEVILQLATVQKIMKDAMQEADLKAGKDGDYGMIPGTKKPTLLKPGAEKLMLAFRLSGVVDRAEVVPLAHDHISGHREVIVYTKIVHTPSDTLLAIGVGSCSTMESKYRWRTGEKEFTDKPVPKEYWDNRESNFAEAMTAIGGKGHTTGKHPDTGKWVICRQGEKAENPDPADVYNTVLKMAKKRSVIDGVLQATAASTMFTQDMEDMQHAAPTETPAPAAEEAPRQTTKAKTARSSSAHEESAPPATANPTPEFPVMGIIEKINTKDGGTDKKPWTKTSVMVGGAWYATFDTTDGDTLMNANELDQAVAFEGVKKGEYWNIVPKSVRVLGEVAEDPAPPTPTNDDPN